MRAEVVRVLDTPSGIDDKHRELVVDDRVGVAPAPQAQHDQVARTTDDDGRVIQLHPQSEQLAQPISITGPASVLLKANLNPWRIAPVVVNGPQDIDPGNRQ